MSRKLLVTVFVVVLSLMAVVPTFAAAGGRPKSGVVIYVTGQDLYYDSMVGPNLPARGRFQELVVTSEGLQTEFGPGDHDYVGGRWWVDVNGDRAMDEGDLYFSCPLLGPGRSTP